ncbi:MAG: CDP-alcohol phosphatidyltransferase family protein [Flavobacterium sp.]
MNIKRLIPNLFTMLNLFCGCVALVLVSDLNFEWAFYFVGLGIFFDFFDGFFARKFNVAGPLGVQLDSLADMVTSGVVPGYVVYKMLQSTRNPLVMNMDWYHYCLPFFGFIITLGACYRLAKFNIDTRQSDSFIGLPTPANCLFITSLPLVIMEFYASPLTRILTNEWFLIGLSLLSAFVMNAEIPLFSLKIKNFSFARYKLQIFFLVLCLILLIFLQLSSVPLIILVYVLLSVINNLLTKKASE